MTKIHKILSIITTLLFAGIVLFLLGMGIYTLIAFNRFTGIMTSLPQTDLGQDPNSVIGGWQVLGNLGLTLLQGIGAFAIVAIVILDLLMVILYLLPVISGIVLNIIDIKKNIPVLGIIDAGIKMVLVVLPFILAFAGLIQRINFLDVLVILSTMGIGTLCVAQLAFAINAQRLKKIKG